jgi:hypothetical protein
MNGDVHQSWLENCGYVLIFIPQDWTQFSVGNKKHHGH